MNNESQRKDWRWYFVLATAFRDQRGQRDIFDWAANVAPNDPLLGAILFELITGYGKTIVAYGVYWILRRRGIVDNLLVLVPSDQQRTQFFEDADNANALLGIDVESWMIEKTGREHRIVADGKIRIFIACYQQLEDGGFFHDLLSARENWLIVCDEVHHLGELGRWADRQSKLPNVRARIGLSSTPERNDGKDLHGFPGKPSVSVGYKEAYDEEVVKMVRGNIDHFYIDVDINGEHKRLTTESLKKELKEEDITDFAKYEAKKQLRYNSRYLDKSLIAPIQDFLSRESRYPGQNKGVVFCMTCRHADYSCDQFNSMTAQMGYPLVGCWIGVGEGNDGLIKTKEENDLTLKVFKAGWEGLKEVERMRCITLGIPERIDFLFQVGKAEEGFNCKKVSIIVFLHLICSEPKLLQQIGRGLRRNAAIRSFADDTVSVYATADTAIADLIIRMEAEINKSPDGDPTKEPGPVVIPPIPDLILIDAFYKNTDFVTPDGVDILSPELREFINEFNIPLEVYLKLHPFGIPFPHKEVPQPQKMKEQDLLKQYSEQVTKNVTLLTGSIMRLMKSNGHPIDKALPGKIKHLIHLKWIEAGGRNTGKMLATDFLRKNQWLQSLAESIRQTHEVPPWVRL